MKTKSCGKDWVVNTMCCEKFHCVVCGGHYEDHIYDESIKQL